MRRIDNKLIYLGLYDDYDLDNIAEKISEVRDNLRDLADFIDEE